jgi:hypothetical protein
MLRLKTIIPILVLAVLALSACAQTSLAKPEAAETPTTSQVQPEVVVEPESGGDIGGNCTRNSDETQLFVNFVQGYCLQYPVGYDLALANAGEVMFFKRSILSVSEPNFRIDVQPANGVSVEQAADKVELQYAIPGSEPARIELSMDGEKAIMLDGLSGQDPNRQVVVVHHDILYTLFFMQMDKNQPEVVAQAEQLYNTVVQSFNFRPEANACPDCSASSDTIQEVPPGAQISGWVWHDLCDSGKDGQPAPVTTPPGCVNEVSPLGIYHADGVMATNEPLIEGVVVTLGGGECPSTGMAETSTIITDLSYSFTELKAGTYCVSIDPQREPNFSILRPGIWTYPTISEDVIQTTVTLTAGEYRGMVNFGWDYQFQP